MKKFKHNAGYVIIEIPEYPFCNKDGRMLEHRYVMEQHLGRQLKPEEEIHHINGIKDDNRIENLQLFANTTEHLGHERKIGTYDGLGFKKGVKPLPHKNGCGCFRCSGILAPHKQGCQCFRCMKGSPTAYSFKRGTPPAPHKDGCKCFRCKSINHKKSILQN